MKAVILAGGLGTRISEETHVRPKPMVEIGGRPILWHIMKIYSSYGINDFVVCLGYKGYVIKEYFSNYLLHVSDVTFDLQQGQMQIHHQNAEPWRITLVDTGQDTLTAGRLLRTKQFVESETFCFTYGDGLADVNITELLAYHGKQKTMVTLTAVQPPGRYGVVSVDGGLVKQFSEKPQVEGGRINGGFFVVEPSVFNLIEGEKSSWEGHVLPRLAKNGELASYDHHGFWLAMDTLRDKNALEDLWISNKAAWAVWR